MERRCHLTDWDTPNVEGEGVCMAVHWWGAVGSQGEKKEADKGFS